MRFSTLFQYIDSLKDANDKGVTLIYGSSGDRFLSYNELYGNALKVLGYLQAQGVCSKDELVLQVEDEEDFLTIFWGCILGGIIPVPLAIGRKDDHKLKVFNVWTKLNNPYLISDSSASSRLHQFATNNEFEKPWVQISKRLFATKDAKQHCIKGKPIHPSEDDLAYIQFSSGSTGDPKGVRLTHRNLVANANAILNGINSPESGDRFLSWMPLTHDMGLIGYHLVPVLAGWQHYVMPTPLFIRRPSLWLQKIHEYGITFTASPNFGYKYLLARLNKSLDLKGVDMSSVRIITNGAEPISPEICNRFVEELTPWGLKKHVIFPVYGLAEASLAVTFSEPEQEIRTLCIDRDSLNVGQKIKLSNSGEDSVSLVNVGRPVDYCNIRIVSEKGDLVNGDVVGHIQIKGKNVTDGYYNNQEATQKVVLKDGWLDTGDLGFINNHSLYVVGRSKDIIFINGQNYYPHDLENTIEKAKCVEPGKVIVSAVKKHNSSNEEEVAAFILHKGTIESFIPIVKHVKDVVNSAFGFELDHILPVREIPKTTSGKVQRFKVAKYFQDGSLDEHQHTIVEILNKERSAGIPTGMSELERKLYFICRDSLECGDFELQTDFFELGVNSLKVGEILAQISNEFSVELSFSELFEKRCVEDLAKLIAQKPQETTNAIKASPATKCYELSSVQHGMYHIWYTNQSSVAYNMPSTFKIIGEVDIEKLEKAILFTLGSNDIFKTSFKAVNGEPVQYINADLKFKVSVSKAASSDINACIREKIRPFDLHSEALIRFELINISNKENILLIDCHHIISDGFSVYYLLQNILNYYAGEALFSSSLNFCDYVAWEQKLKSTEVYEKHRQFWIEELNEIPVLELPTDHPRPQYFDYNGRKLPFQLDEDLSNELRKLARENNITLHLLLLSCYYLLLAKYTGQEDIVVGVPTNTRKSLSEFPLYGILVNNLPVKCSLDSNMHFIDLLKSVQKNFLAAYDHQKYPISQLSSETGRRRDISRNQIFDSMFVFQDMPDLRLRKRGISVERYFYDPLISKYDLTMEVFDDSQSVTYYLEYATSLFDVDTINNLSRHLQNLLKGLSENLNRRLSDISLLDSWEYNLLTADKCQDQEFPHLQNVTIHELFERQVASTPVNIAVWSDDQKWTFAELDNKANRIAQSLQTNGSLQGTPIVILLDRSPEFMASVLGILKVGASFVPVDIQFPEERIEYIIEDTHTPIIISNSWALNGKSKLKEKHSTKFLLLDDESYELDLGDEVYHSDPTVQATDLAYIIYTSGTSGNPKGVMVEHKAAVNYISWASDTYFKKEETVIPLFTSVSFDLTITSILAPLVGGHCIRCYADNSDKLPLEMVLDENVVDVIKLTPSHLQLMSLLWKGQKVKSRIQRIIVGGENFETDLAKKTSELFEGRAEIINEYGPTEAAVGCMISYFDSDYTGLSVPIGKEILQSQIFILDSDMQPVPDGVKGEVYISGICLARGYWNKPMLTEERFLPNPFSKNSRVYKTGDLAKRDREGRVIYLGRQDDQVKIKGYRVEIDEVKSNLNQHPDVEEVAILVKKQGCENKLVAYYRAGHAGVSSQELHQFMLVRLPQFMIPQVFIAVDHMPLTRSGKIDYRALEGIQPSAELPQKQKTLNQLELLVVEAWAKFLNHDRILLTDNFYELGGDSIKAVQISSYLNQKGYSLPPKDILTRQSIEQVIPVIKKSANQSYNQSVLSGTKEFLPVDKWFFNQMFQNYGFYNQSVFLLFKEQIDVEKLQHVFQKLIVHHDGLRINYDENESRLFYNNDLIQARFKVDQYDIQGLLEQHPQEVIEIGEKIKGSIDIHSDFPLKAIIIRDSSQNWLLITAHHLVIDGVSWRILLEDFYNLYLSLDFKLPQKTASPLEYISVQKVDDIQPTQSAFRIPLDYETEEWSVSNQMSLNLMLSKNTLQGLISKETHEKYNTDVFIVLLSALTKAVQSWSEQSNIVIEIEGFGRNLNGLDVSRTVGWFTVFYPLEVNVKLDSRYSDIILSVKEQVRGRTSVNFEPAGMRSEIRFNYLGHFDKGVSDNDLFEISNHETGRDVGPENHMTSKLEIDCYSINDEFVLNAKYNSKAHQHSTIKVFIESFEKEITHVVSHLKSVEERHFSPTDFDEVIDNEDMEALFS